MSRAVRGGGPAVVVPVLDKRSFSLATYNRYLGRPPDSGPAHRMARAPLFVVFKKCCFLVDAAPVLMTGSLVFSLDRNTPAHREILVVFVLSQNVAACDPGVPCEEH